MVKYQFPCIRNRESCRHWSQQVITLSHITVGGLINFGHSRGGPNREGGLFTKLNDLDTNGSFSVLLLHILQIQHTILGVKSINSTQFLS